MFRKVLNDEFVGDELRWCVENNVLPNTRYTLEGNNGNRVYSTSEIGIIFSNLLNQLFDSKDFMSQLRKNVIFTVTIDEVKNEAKKDSNIHEALYKDIKSLGYKEFSVFDVFFSLISDVLLVLEFKEHNLKTVVENDFQDRLMTKNDFVALKTFRTLVCKVLKNAINNLENNERNLLKIDGEWTEEVYVDNELVNLMNCGSVSGIYNKIRFTLTSDKTCVKCSEIESSRGYQKVKATLMIELGKLSKLVTYYNIDNNFRSRQIMFTRLLNYLARLINRDEKHLYSYLVIKTEYNLNVLIWNLVYSAIEDSGLKRLHYDDNDLINCLYKLKARGISVLRLFGILEYNPVSYIGNKLDFESLKNKIDTQKYFEGKKYFCNNSSFVKLVYNTKGLGPFESEIYQI